MKSWRNLVVGGRAVVLLALGLGSVLACKGSDSGDKPASHEGGAPGSGGVNASDAGQTNEVGGSDATLIAGAGGAGQSGGAPDAIGMAGGSSEPGSWDTSFWDDAVWQ